MKLEETKPGVFTATMTAHELSVLFAGARMSLSLMEAKPEASEARARSALESVLGDFDAALARTRGQPEGGD
jgi:hypothetical protein